MEADQEAKRNGGSNSASSGIFRTLFGDFSEQAATTSMFSDDNPFRRKPGDHYQTPSTQQQRRQRKHLGSGADSAGDVGSPENPNFAGSENPNFADAKKRKERSKEKNTKFGSGSVDDDLETQRKIKKLKGDELKRSAIDTEEADDESEKKPLDLGGFVSKGLRKKGIGKDRNPGTGLNEPSEGNGKTLTLDTKPNGIVGLDIKGENLETGKLKAKKNEKKKRKRDEVEAEYEAKHYGALMGKEETGESGLGATVVGEKRKTFDNPEEMLVSKEGFDDEEKLLRTVFIGNLPLKVKKKALLKEFSQFGEVESVRIRSIPVLDSKVPRKGAIIKKQINDAIDSVHAYIVFKTGESALASLGHNMAMVGGKHIRVDRACPPRKKLKGEDSILYDNKRTVFVGNLPFDVKDEEIYQLFCGINNLESCIEAIRVIRDPSTCIGKGIAYILFKTRDAANLVVKKRNLKLRDRDLRLFHASSNSTPAKRKNPSPGEANDSPAKKFAVDSRSPDGNKVKPKASMSYQGIRASKSGVQKKVRPKIMEPLNTKSSTQKREKPKERKSKRPAVAARKANTLKGAGGKAAGMKRKMESRTPEKRLQNKKARKFR